MWTPLTPHQISVSKTTQLGSGRLWIVEISVVLTGWGVASLTAG